MLEKLICLNNVGVFRSLVPSALPLKKATLVYADNARGKSTLAAILQACSVGDATAVAARVTISSQEPPKIQLRFVFPNRSTTVSFAYGKWDGIVPNLQVFDQGFVERNIYAGSEVHPENHQALLDFALGTAAVAKKQQVDLHAAEQIAATKRRTSEEDKLKGYVGQSGLSVYLALPELEDADTRIAAQEKRLADARETSHIVARRALRPLELPTFHFTTFAAVAASALEQLHVDADAMVRAHIQTHGGVAAERWLTEGQPLQKDQACPFCAQDTKGVALVAAYKAYFNEAYVAHMSSVYDLGHKAAGFFVEATLASLEAAYQANHDRVIPWAGQVKIELVDVDFAEVRMLAGTAREALVIAAKRKASTPLIAVPLDATASEAFAEILTWLGSYNSSVAIANDAIAAFKKGLVADDVATLEKSLATLKLRKTRYSVDVVGMVQARAAADAARTAAEDAKAVARGELDALMSSVLSSFQTSINRWLQHYGAPFSIDKMKPTYLGGGTPRTEYGIVLRGATFTAGRKSHTEPSFHTALSDGDKRTLAMAFFLAKLLDDKDAAHSIVVLDDAFTSLDKHRRTQTVTAVVEIAQRCSQVIVLAHDAYFLRDLSRKLVEKKVPETLALHLRRGPDNYSLLEGCDFDEICASPYYQRYRLVQQFVTGDAATDLLAVSQALRPLLEGNLHRRFPGQVKEGVTFGLVLDQIRNAKPGNPLAVLKPSVDALVSFNEFAGAFHHDTPGVAARNDVTDGELQVFASQAMTFIHSGSLP